VYVHSLPLHPTYPTPNLPSSNVACHSPRQGTQVPAHPGWQGQRAQRRSSPTPTWLWDDAPHYLSHSWPRSCRSCLPRWPARWKRMIDRQLPGEAVVNNQSRCSCAFAPLPACLPLKTVVFYLTRVHGSQTLIVHDPRRLLADNPSWRPVMRWVAAPSPWCLGWHFVKPGRTGSALYRILHSCSPAPTPSRPHPPWLSVGRVPALCPSFRRHPHLTHLTHLDTPARQHASTQARVLLLRAHPGPRLANQTRLCQPRRTWERQ
jgi:hypothetical protein